MIYLLESISNLWDPSRVGILLLFYSVFSQIYREIAFSDLEVDTGHVAKCCLCSIYGF